MFLRTCRRRCESSRFRSSRSETHLRAFIASTSRKRSSLIDGGQELMRRAAVAAAERRFSRELRASVSQARRTRREKRFSALIMDFAVTGQPMVADRTSFGFEHVVDSVTTKDLDSERRLKMGAGGTSVTISVF